MELTIQDVKDQAESAITVYRAKVAGIHKITTEGQLAGAVLLKKQIDIQVVTVKDGMKLHISNAKKSLKDLKDTELKALSPFQVAIEVLKALMLGYHTEKARIVEQKRREEADKQKILEVAEKIRQEAEKKAEAKRLYDAGQAEAAKKKLAEPTKRAPSMVPVAAPVKTKVSGGGIATRWKAVLVDISKVDRRFLKFDQVGADAFATEHKDKAKDHAMAAGLEFKESTYLSGK